MLLHKYNWCSVKFWRSQGVNCKWSRTTAGAPVMLIEFRGRFELLSKQAWAVIRQQLDDGKSLADACFSAWGLADVFSVPALHRDILSE